MILHGLETPVWPVNIATEKICIGRGLAAIRASNKVEVDFLYYFFLKNETDITGNTGAIFNSINKSQIENLKIPLPPLEIQIQITDTLNEIFMELKKLDLLSSKKTTTYWN